MANHKPGLPIKSVFNWAIKSDFAMLRPRYSR
jgi:hypothetical protein